VARARLPLPFGVGVDRAAGVGVDAARVEDLRNVLPKEGVWAARKGLEETVQISMSGGGPAEDINFIGLVKSAGISIVIASIPGGGAVTNNVQVVTISNLGFNPVYVPASALTVPASAGKTIWFGVDTYDRMFLAHDEADIALRIATRVYNAGTNTIANLEASLDGGALTSVKFRGVCTWLDRVIGWGYGTASDPDRPETVRASLAGQPTVFRPEHYWNAGARSEPVLVCVPVRTSVLALKQQSIYEIFGHDARSFGVRLQDPRYGVASGRLAVEVTGTVYFWSLEGPQPSALAADGVAEWAWAHYVPEDRLVLFAFPNPGIAKTRCYALSLRDPQNPRWVYFEYQAALLCAGTIWSAAGGAPTGYPDIGTLTSSGQTVTVPWDNVNEAGDETVEVWFKRDSGAYAKYTEVFVAGDAQSLEIGLDAGILPSETVTVALRYRRGVKYTSGYEDPVTSGWGATPVANSVASIVMPAAPVQPTNPQHTGTTYEVIGSKTYMLVDIAWDNGIAAAANRRVQILESAVRDADEAVVVATVDVVGGVGATQSVEDYGAWLVTGGAAIRYLWVRHLDEAELTSGAVQIPGPEGDGGFDPGSLA
jgi:hypothetical protein